MGGFFANLFGTSGAERNANAASGQAIGNAGSLTGAGQGIFANIIPTLNRAATGSAPGFSTPDLAQMLNQAQLSTAGKTGSMAEDAKLRALRTGNPAAINATADSMARSGSEAAGNTVQDILASNAKLKQQQQSQALGDLTKIGSTQLGTGAEWGGQEAKDIQTQLQADTAPFSDLMGILKFGAQIAPGIQNMFKGSGSSSGSGGDGTYMVGSGLPISG